MATRVLIVEDDFDTRNSLCDILSLEGYQINTAETAEDAIRQIDKQAFDFIIIDWYLSNMTAGEFLPQLCSHAPGASILIATGSSEIMHAVHAMQHGASDYVVKPICTELLLGSMRRAMKLQLAQRRAIQSERLAAVGTAVTAVAHESRNALHRIRSRVSLIRLTYENNAELLEDLSAIEEASSLLESYFEELREFSAPIVLSKTPCGLKNLVLRVWNHVQCVAASSDSLLTLPDHDVQCMLDPVRIEQVLRNLFENAIAASDGNARVDMDWSPSEFDDQGTLCITVSDNGNGFTAEQRMSAFDPFFTTKVHGTGLGLPICRRIIEAHGGSIAVEENGGSGGIITIALPGLICNSECQPAICSAYTE
ncbi:ATP-binding protein [Rubripirellula reticaptiva]|uniref:histidine kinase n=1 Tax=Rubripirellula reticaptiva TaxID=2528013 RepID=A0A5C6ECM4_9BACT|nr:ATP-binding protein [Rubripirellula reticaptiva]TWU46658.1 Sensor protein ZraS [Rubripirellula reticaptiva]